MQKTRPVVSVRQCWADNSEEGETKAELSQQVGCTEMTPDARRQTASRCRWAGRRRSRGRGRSLGKGGGKAGLRPAEEPGRS
eukprot:2181777-Rhodomonas_salina.3